MNALILAAGYATRLYPLTRAVAKPLLPIGDRPMIDYIVDAIREVPEVVGVHVVTNSRFAGSFRRWTASRAELPLTVHDDGTTSNEDRLGAIGDIRLVVERAGLDGDDLLVVAGDNLFTFSLDAMVRHWREKGERSVLAVRDVGSRDLAREYGVVELGEDDRVVGFVEKPDDPPSTLAATATYVFGRAHVRLFESYLAEGNPPDPSGPFVAWLHRREPVYGFRFEGEWMDIGDRAQLLEADNRLRRRNGLRERAEYTLDE